LVGSSVVGIVVAVVAVAVACCAGINECIKIGWGGGGSKSLDSRHEIVLNGKPQRGSKKRVKG